MPNVVSLRLPSYRRHKASGQAVVTLHGRDICLGKHGSAASQEEYRRVIAENLLGSGATSNPHTVSVAEVMAAYLRHANGYYRKNGEVTREFGLLVESCRFVRSRYGRSPAVEFGPQSLKAVRQTMIEADHSRKFINKNIDLVRRMFKWAASEELIPASVPQALAMVTGLRQGRCAARETSPVLPVEDSVIEATLPFLPVVVADMVRVQRLTSARPSEICQLRPGDVERIGEICVYRPESHKTQHVGHERLVFIGPQAQLILAPYLDRDAADYCFQPKESEAARRRARQLARNTPLSCGNRAGTNRMDSPSRSAGRCYSTASFRRAIHRACDQAFSPPERVLIGAGQSNSSQSTIVREWRRVHRWAPNRLRHAAATAIRREFGLEAAQVILGHRHAEVTQVYAERDLAKGLEVARNCG